MMGGPGEIARIFFTTVALSDHLRLLPVLGKTRAAAIPVVAFPPAGESFEYIGNRRRIAARLF